MEGAGNSANSTEIFGNGAENAARGGFDVLTLVMGVAVFACAILFGVLVGRHLGMQTAKVHRQTGAPSSAAVNAPAPAGAPTSVNSSGTTESARETAPRAPSSKRNAAAAAPPGSLLVYENGKEIFRMPPASGGSGAAPDHEAGMQPVPSLRPEKKQMGAVVELPPEVAETSLLYRVEPEYPQEARQQKIQGAVVLEVHIAPEGTVEDVQAVSGPPQLAQAATAAVKQWRFKPRRQNGQAVRMQTLITLNFRLPQ
jgi:protein TonB